MISSHVWASSSFPVLKLADAAESRASVGGKECREHCIGLTRRSISGPSEDLSQPRANDHSHRALGQLQKLRAMPLCFAAGLAESARRQIREANVLYEYHLYRQNRCRYDTVCKDIALALRQRGRHTCLPGYRSLINHHTKRYSPVLPVPSATPCCSFSETDATDIDHYRYVMILDCTH